MDSSSDSSSKDSDSDYFPGPGICNLIYWKKSDPTIPKEKCFNAFGNSIWDDDKGCVVSKCMEWDSKSCIKSVKKGMEATWMPKKYQRQECTCPDKPFGPTAKCLPPFHY